MHIPDSILDPSVEVATGAMAVAGLVYCTRVVERQLRDRTSVMMGTMAAFLFAAQMVNFWVMPGVSGHLLGGVLAAVMLGPWAGAGVIAAVLFVQCFLFNDGGKAALGANFVNMGLIGSVGGYAIYAPLRRMIGGRHGVLIGAMVAAWFSVLMAAGAFAVELTVGGRGRFTEVLTWMVLIHAAIGLGEAIITGLVLKSVLLARPDLIYQPELPPGRLPAPGQAVLAGLLVSVAVAAFLAPFASSSPDGLEAVGERLRFMGETEPVLPSLLDDYALPWIEHAGATVAVAGVLGTLAVFAAGLALGRAFGRPEPALVSAAADAA